MSLQTRLEALVTAIGADVKNLRSTAVSKAYVDALSYLDAYTPQVGWLATDSGLLSAQAGIALVSGKATFHRLFLMPGTYDSVWVNCSTAQSGGTVTLQSGLYPDDGTGSWPDTTATPLASGSFTTPVTTGMKQANLATPLVLSKPTLLWSCVLYIATVAPTTPPVLSASGNNLQNYGRPSNIGLTTPIRGYLRTGLAALPTTACTTANTSASGSADVTTTAIRRSA